MPKAKSEQEEAELYYRAGLKYYHGDGGVTSNMPLARMQFEICVSKNENHGAAQQKLGDIYEYGRGIKSDLEKALFHYSKSAEQQNPMGLFCLGRLFESGKGVKKDLKKAGERYLAAFQQNYEGWEGYFKDFLIKNPAIATELQKKDPLLLTKLNEKQVISQQATSAAQHGAATATATSAAAELTPKEYYELGLKHYHDKVNPDMKKARESFEKAVQSDSFEKAMQSNRVLAGALQKLGDIYEAGRGVPKDFTKAESYYRRSAANGDVCGTFCLGRCYELGRGVPKDLKRAADLYKLAYDQGYEGWEGYFSRFLSENPSMKTYLYGQSDDKSKLNGNGTALLLQPKEMDSHKKIEGEPTDEKQSLLKRK